jgi:hypothetical protein
MSEAVLDWDCIVHKNVRTSDNEPVGNIIAVDNDSMIITSQGGRSEYKIPKSKVELFNGAEVFLNFPYGQLRMFKV